MSSTPPPPARNYGLSSFPRMNSSPKYRNSIGSSFSFGPQHMVDLMQDPNTSAFSNQSPSALDPNGSILAASPLRSSPRKRRKRKESTGKHPLATDTTDIFGQSDEEREEEFEEEEDTGSPSEWSTIDRMRLWRHDALLQHLYDTAAFWGDKIVSWTNDPNDVFWLAQTYFQANQFARAERLLTRPFPLASPASQQNGHGNGKGKGREVDPFPARLPAGRNGMIQVSAQLHDGVSRLVDMSIACRYLAAQCQVRQGNWQGALELLGESNPFRGSSRSGPAIPNTDGGIKIEASMCNLRGILMVKTNRTERAKQCFMEALALDVKCYEAFDQLMSGEMMTPEEEWEFVQGLQYTVQTPEDADFVRLIYQARLRKYKHVHDQVITRKRLIEDYGLSDNPDVLCSFADALYHSFKWADCFVITTRILDLVAVHDQALPLHIACMYYLTHMRSKLFVLAHEMVDREPENPLAWYAVGVWYLAGAKYPLARQYFGKVSLMDPRFAPAWIAFAHTFAFEGEHDHAVTAYSTSARMFNGSHLPLMFVGMEHITLSNHELAEEALNAAHSMCQSDPLLINERGVMAFYRGEYELAATMFQQAIDLAQITQSSHKTWAATYLNLGTCYRKLKRYEEAKKSYTKVLELDHRNHLAFGFLGMTHHLIGEVHRAIERYHESLSIHPINGLVLELLNLALETVNFHRDRDPKPEPQLFTMLQQQFNI